MRMRQIYGKIENIANLMVLHKLKSPPSAPK